MYLRDQKEMGAVRRELLRSVIWSEIWHNSVAEPQRVSLVEQRRVSTARNSGFTLMELMIVVGLLGLLCAITIPNFVRARGESHKNSCINNLRQIDDALQLWAVENGAATGQAPPDSSVLLTYLRGKVTCPAGGTTFVNSYALPETVTETPTCRIVPTSHRLDGKNGKNGHGVKAHGHHGNGNNGNGNGVNGNGGND